MSRSDAPPWSHIVRLSEIGRIAQPVRLEPDAAARGKIAATLDLIELPRLSGEVRLTPWLDGVEIVGQWSAEVVYRCGITTDPFGAELNGRFTLRAVPPDSPQATPPEGEIELDLESEDPPDVLEDERIDLGGYLIEHLALELDPFPRKPDAVFEPPPPEAPESPFAVLRRLRPEGDS